MVGGGMERGGGVKAIGRKEEENIMRLSHRAFTLHSGCIFSPFTTVVVSRAKFQKKKGTRK